MPQLAVITGSNGRIGQATCRRLAQDGYAVVGIDVGEATNDAKAMGNWPYYACNLADLDAMAATFTRIEKEHGLIRVLFNNAGIYHHGQDFFEVTPEGYDATMAVNLRVPFFASQWVAKRLVAASETGAIVNTASVAGQSGSGIIEYGASKAGLINMTRSLGRALGKHGIRVNAIAPGLVNTAMGDRVADAARERMLKTAALGRAAEAEEMASVVSFLLGPDASFITCATIDVNGGL